ncbi:G5 domain [Syntrophomonas zehnderi OL-4]|uniref:G5 domain n=1 Tax=Syntrophomonas zehnderi OL-4 TaxID=690567 RepID=A0A0E3W2M3_9FIRM|nr:3D domain-containing protein [Syntrophomonas zehnderi]CFX09572.1 G5 domain [Syntrophomonas zehnderi OL-4]
MNLAWSRRGIYILVGLVTVGVLFISLFFALQKPVSVIIDGKLIKSSVLFTGTVGDVLAKNHIKLGQMDKVEPGIDAGVKKNMKIIVTRAFKVKVLADGQVKTIYTTPVSVKEAVELAGFEMGEKDMIKTLATAKVRPNQEIELIRVTEQELTIEEPLPFGVERVDDPTLERGLTKTVKAGKNGVARNKVRITFYNGQEGKREVIGTEVLVPPENKILAMGSITAVSRGGERMNFREARYMQATAYTYTGYRTATGLNPAVGMVAVDPRVIPLGTRLYVEGYGYARAADTGGAVKGDKIDLFMEEYKQCINWGRRVVKVYILE